MYITIERVACTVPICPLMNDWLADVFRTGDDDDYGSGTGELAKLRCFALL